jgi:hypothetical protein
MEGHPGKRLRNQKYEDFEKDMMLNEKPCVTIINKRA